MIASLLGDVLYGWESWVVLAVALVGSWYMSLWFEKQLSKLRWWRETDTDTEGTK
jgi:hypothetical protein